MDSIRVLLTGVGCPGAITVIEALKENGEQPVYIIGTDMSANAAGRWFVDEFHQVPPGRKDQEFAEAMLHLAKWTRPDVIFPQLSYEVQAWANHREEFDCPVMVANPELIQICSSKVHTYRNLTGIPIIKHRVCHDLQEFMFAVCDFGYPSKPVCVKPLMGKGSRGFHVLDAKDDRGDRLLNARPGEGFRPTFFELIGIVGQMNPFPHLLVMEFIEGPEITADVFCEGGEILMGFLKTREAIRAGLAMRFEIKDDPDLWGQALVIARQLNLSAFANIQFKGGRLLEINPRISTMMIQSNFNMPWLAVKYTLGLAGADELRAASECRSIGLRSIRYFNQIFPERTPNDESQNCIPADCCPDSRQHGDGDRHGSDGSRCDTRRGA